MSTRSDTRAEQSPRPTKGAALSTLIKALKQAHTTEVGALKKEHQTALKEACFEERRKHHDKQQEVVGPLKEAPENAKQKAAEVEVSDVTVQVNQEKALRMELEGQLVQGLSLAKTLKTQLDSQKEMTAQWRELYQSMAAKGGST